MEVLGGKEMARGWVKSEKEVKKEGSTVKVLDMS